MTEITITHNEAGQRFDKLLSKYLNDASKSFIYKMLRKKNIVLNGKKATGSEKLVVGDVVKLFLADDTIAKFSNVKIQTTTTQIEIIYEDNDILIINKPAGMLSQKAVINDESLVEHLISYLLRSQQLTETEMRSFKPSVCNRLDRNTSGLIVAGKSLLGLQVMTNMFKERTLNKYYRCIVRGEVKEKQYIKGFLKKNEATNKVVITKAPMVDSYEIETEYQPICSNGVETLLEVHLITGKTHQIRAHLASMGYPIIGDYKYGDKKINDKYKNEFGLKYQLLHAYRLEFPASMIQLKQLEKKQFIVKMPVLFHEIYHGG
ncbi:MAG: RluA family pseudouridine synthase, partial [Paludibacter sp.]|nr:RluA family pseudouridine synthase [Paludibacter sp.]